MYFSNSNCLFPEQETLCSLLSIGRLKEGTHSGVLVTVFYTAEINQIQYKLKSTRIYQHPLCSATGKNIIIVFSIIDLIYILHLSLQLNL